MLPIFFNLYRIILLLFSGWLVENTVAVSASFLPTAALLALWVSESVAENL